MDFNNTGALETSIADRINDVIPGLRTSTAFFTFLHANLTLTPSAMTTPLLEPTVSTPTSAATSAALTPTTSTETATSPALSSLDDIPPLTLNVLTDSTDQLDALNLVADSIAQQRQRASLTLVYHPATLAALVVVEAIAYRVTWGAGKDSGTTMAVVAGLLMAYLLCIRWASSGYLQLAESFTPGTWLRNEDGEPDIIIGTKYGKEIVGALVLRLEPATSAGSSPTNKKNKKGSGANLKGGVGVIRAWTTILRYRKRGLGKGMLEEAVQVTRDKCGKDAKVFFAEEHVNSQMILPEMFNGPFRKSEKDADKMLDEVLAEWDGSRRKKR